MPRFNTVKHNSETYIQASQVPEYAKALLLTPFDIPSARTLRYYVRKGLLRKPQRLGKVAYYESSYILDFIKRRMGETI